MVWELCRGGGGAAPGDPRRWEDRKGNRDEPEFLPVLEHFTVRTSDGWKVCPRLSPRPRESISRVLFYLAGNNFWLHRSAHKFSLGNVVQIRARRQCTACARSSSIQLTRIELLLRTRSSSGSQRGAGKGRQAKGGSREARFRPPPSAEPQGRAQLHFEKLAGREVRAPRLGALTRRPKGYLPHSVLLPGLSILGRAGVCLSA